MAGIELRTLQPVERSAFLDLMEVAFSERDLFARYLEVGLVGPDDTLVALDGTRLVSSVQIFDKRIRLGRAVAGVGGIGSVATHPEYERRGLATLLLRRAIEEMQRRGHCLSLLFTGRLSFYDRLGWESVPQTAWSIRRDARAPSSAPAS